MFGFLKQSTAVTVKIGPFVDNADGDTVEGELTIAQADVRLSKNGGDMAQKNEGTTCSYDELGYYDCPLDTTDTGTLGRLDLMVHESGALPVRHTYIVLPANTYDSLVDGSDKLQADVVQALGAAVGATTGKLHVLDDEGNTVANETKQDAIKAKTDLLPSGVPKGVELTLPFLMALDGEAATGKTVTLTISKDGGAFASSTNSVTEISSGWYKIVLTAAEMNAGTVAIKASATGCDTTNMLLVTST